MTKTQKERLREQAIAFGVAPRWPLEWQWPPSVLRQKFALSKYDVAQRTGLSAKAVVDYESDPARCDDDERARLTVFYAVLAQRKIPMPPDPTTPPIPPSPPAVPPVPDPTVPTPAPPTLEDLAKDVDDKAAVFGAAKAKADASQAQAQADQAAEHQAHVDLQTAIATLKAAADAEDAAPGT